MTFKFASTGFDLKTEALKNHLIECVKSEKETFVQLADEFYRQARRSDADYKALCAAIIAASNQLLKANDWDSSLFLRNTLNPIKKIRDYALELQAELEGSNPRADIVSTPLSNDQVKLYVSLYQANGHDLKAWALQLASIANHLIGRPVYESEESVISAIRPKLSQVSEAYAIVFVEKSKIIGEDQMRPRKDRFDNRIINLLPNALTGENVREFVHLQKRYYFKNLQLIPIEG